VIEDTEQGESTGRADAPRIHSRVSARIAAIEESATLAISAKAKRLRSEGVHVVDYGAGEPDFPTPAHVVEAAARACADPRNHKYTPNAGLPELREAIAAKTKRDSGFDVDASQVLVTNGGKQSVYQSFATLLDPGDEVLIAAPYWVTYPEAVRLAGGVPVAVPTTADNGFRVSLDDVERAITDRTKILLFVSPSNPTGVVYPPEEVEALGRLAAERGLWVITDEIYEHLVYEGHEFVSIAAAVPALSERCLVINGVSKTYAMTGWRLGWTIGPADVMAAQGNLQSHLTSNVNNVAQAAALAALTGAQDDVAWMRDAFDRRRRRMMELMAAIPGVECVEPGGAFYAFPSFEGLLGRDLGGAVAHTTVELGELLLERIQVAVVPGEAFGAPGFARLSYALGDEDLALGLQRIADLANGRGGSSA